MNTIKTGLLLGALTGLLMLIGGWFGGQQGVVIAFIFAMVMNFGSYWFSDKLVLSMYHAQPVSESEAPELYAMVKNLALKASLPMPRVYIIPGDTPNAFATGRNEHHAVVAVTEGILRILDPGGTGRGHRPRTDPHQEPRHPDRLHRRDAGRGHRHAGQHGPVGRDVRRSEPRRRRGRRRQSSA